MMSRVHCHEPRRPERDVREEFVPGAMPLDPDVGPVPFPLQDDPGREIDPGSAPPAPTRRTRRQVAVPSCP